MLETLRNTLYASVGLAYLTKEKVEELAHELIEKGKMSEKEGKEFIDDLVNRSKEAKEKVETQIDTRVKDTLKKMNLVTKQEYEILEKRLKDLEAQLNRK